MNKIKITSIAAITSLLFSMPLLAAGNSGRSTLGAMYKQAGNGSFYVQKATGDWANPDACQAADRVVIASTNAQISELFSATLAAKLANNEVSYYVSGCENWNGVTYPKVAGIYVY